MMCSIGAVVSIMQYDVYSWMCCSVCVCNNNNKTKKKEKNTNNKL